MKRQLLRVSHNIASMYPNQAGTVLSLAATIAFSQAHGLSHRTFEHRGAPAVPDGRVRPAKPPKGAKRVKE